MPELEREPLTQVGGQCGQEAVKPLQVRLEAGRQLKEDWTETLAQPGGPVQQAPQRPDRFAEALQVSDVAARLDREDEARRHAGAPGPEAGSLGQTVEREIDLNGREPLRVEVQAL